MKTDSDPFLKTAHKRRFIGYLKDGDTPVNLAGNYDYLELPYYNSQDIENQSQEVYPSCKEMLDAYITPLFLEKAQRHNLPVPNYYISNGYFEPPVIVDPINPFMIKPKIVTKQNRVQSVGKSMSRNFTYAICCQEIPEGAQVKYFRAILGTTVSSKFKQQAEQIWDVYKIPLAKVRVIVASDGSVLFSDLSQLKFDSLTKRERAIVNERVVWEK